jgi:uncharacterized membrane protein
VVKLKEEFKKEEKYTILAHPTVPPMFKKEGQQYIFIFTPERLIKNLVLRICKSIFAIGYFLVSLFYRSCK